MDAAAGAGTIRILVVDDEQAVRDFVDRVLRAAGYQTALASSGANAIALADTSDPFNLLLTDLRMPEMSGVQLAQTMRAGDPDLKVLYLTGFSDALFTEKAALWEDEAFLDKPCSATALCEAVSLILFGHIAGLREPDDRSSDAS